MVSFDSSFCFKNGRSNKIEIKLLKYFLHVLLIFYTLFLPVKNFILFTILKDMILLCKSLNLQPKPFRIQATEPSRTVQEV